MAFFQPLRALLKRLTLIVAGISPAGGSAVGGELQSGPERAVESVIEEGEGPDVGGMALGPDGGLVEEAEALVARLAIETNQEIRDEAVADLIALMAELSPLRRTDLVCRWATDEEPGKRLAVALALESPLEVNGARTAL